ncbi:MAG: hypothetical protein RL662_2498 [Bacteroidota bacterium]
MNLDMDKTIRRVRIFLRKISWKRFLTFSFFVFIATILWFMQIYNQSFETNIVIPIKYTSVPDSVVFRDTLPSQVEVRVRDTGYRMFKYYFSKRDTVYIDISSVMNDNKSNFVVLNDKGLESYIRRVLPEAALIVRFDLPSISFHYSSLKSRVIPIVFDGQINLSPGYFLNGDIRLVPDSVVAYGASSDLDKLTYAYTTNNAVAGLEADSRLVFELQQNKKVKLVPNKINVYVPVEAYTQKKVDVLVDCLNLPDNLSIKFFPSRVMLSFFVGVSKSDSIDVNDFSVSVDYNGLKESRSASVPVRITSSPQYARNLTIDPPNVEFIFEYKDN